MILLLQTGGSLGCLMAGLVKQIVSTVKSSIIIIQVFCFEVLELWRRKKFRLQTGYIMSHSWLLIYSLIGIVQEVYKSEDGV